MSVYAIGDLHLPGRHDKPMSVFGARWTDHTDKLRRRWNALVGEGDTVVIPGDFSWGMTLGEALDDFRFLASLNGKRKLISKGNHDYWWENVSKLNSFLSENGIEGISFLHNNAFEPEGESVIICGSRGWFIEEKMQSEAYPADYCKMINRECARIRQSAQAGMKLRGERDVPLVLMLHFPPVFEAFVCEPIVDAITECGIDRVYFGHIHGKYAVPQTTEYRGVKFTLVSSDYLDFYPLKISQCCLDDF